MPLLPPPNKPKMRNLPLREAPPTTTNHGWRIMTPKSQTSDRLRIIVHNCAHSTNVIDSILDSAVRSADIVLLQEPWIRMKDRYVKTHRPFRPILPPPDGNRVPPTLIYVSTTHPDPHTQYLPALSNDSD